MALQLKRKCPILYRKRSYVTQKRTKLDDVCYLLVCPDVTEMILNYIHVAYYHWMIPVCKFFRAHFQQRAEKVIAKHGHLRSVCMKFGKGEFIKNYYEEIRYFVIKENCQDRWIFEHMNDFVSTWVLDTMEIENTVQCQMIIDIHYYFLEFYHLVMMVSEICAYKRGQPVLLYALRSIQSLKFFETTQVLRQLISAHYCFKDPVFEEAIKILKTRIPDFGVKTSFFLLLVLLEKMQILQMFPNEPWTPQEVYYLNERYPEWQAEFTVEEKRSPTLHPALKYALLYATNYNEEEYNSDV